MLNNRKLIIDTFAEVYELIKPYSDGEFWTFSEHEIINDAIYVLSREQFNLNIEKVLNMANHTNNCIIVCNAMEGSETLKQYCKNQVGIEDLINEGKILLISGAPLEYNNALTYEHFLCKILEYTENTSEMNRISEIYSKINKPYKFLFLNGRSRYHRKYLLETFKNNNLLNQSLWTNLDPMSRTVYPLKLPNDPTFANTPFEVKHLPAPYEVNEYQKAPIESTEFIKFKLFNQTWGDIYIKAEPYIDTYFSLVTETVFGYPYSFRTEKTWKPVAIGHPFIISSNAGYYRDLHNLGFKTFGHLIDESFDTIDNQQDRMDRLVASVTDLCAQNLPAFLAAAEEVCKYNQQHLVDLAPKLRQEFPQRFIHFINERSRI